jgi:hypothetical protein
LRAGAGFPRPGTALMNAPCFLWIVLFALNSAIHIKNSSIQKTPCYNRTHLPAASQARFKTQNFLFGTKLKFKTALFIPQNKNSKTIRTLIIYPKVVF